MSSRRMTVHPRRAFTLMEVVVSLGIFSIVSLVIVDIYLSANTEERRSLARQSVQYNTRFLVETIARDVRLGTVNHAYYSSHPPPLRDPATGLLNAQDKLALVLNDGSEQYYRCVALHVFETNNPPNEYFDISCSGLDMLRMFGFTVEDVVIQTSVDDSTWSTISIENMDLASAWFVIEPAALTEQIQPRVTIALAGLNLGRPDEQIRTTVQTTVTSRSYGP